VPGARSFALLLRLPGSFGIHRGCGNCIAAGDLLFQQRHRYLPLGRAQSGWLVGLFIVSVVCEYWFGWRRGQPPHTLVTGDATRSPDGVRAC
jgi:hypothetical protein